MSSELRHRRGTESATNAFTGAAGEATYDTQRKTLVAHDGAKQGGFPLARSKDSTKNNSASGVALLNAHTSFLILGDSISESVGASNYMNGVSYQVGRSIMNADNHPGFGADQSYGYHTVINMANAMQETGFSTTGTLVGGGVVGSRLQLLAGQVLTITGRALQYASVFFDASSSSGSIETRYNGTLRNTTVISGSGIQNNFGFALNPIDGTIVADTTDSVEIKAVGGTVIITGVINYIYSNASPTCHVVAKSGTAYQDYTTSSQMDEIAYYLNVFRSGNPKVMLLCLGTNNIYNPSKALSPSAMVTQIQNLILGINTRCSGVTYVVAVPPRAVETTWPVIASGYTYWDYVDAIVDFATTNGYGLIRHDQSQIVNATTGFFPDDVHPNDAGHRVMAKNICDALGVRHDPYFPVLIPSSNLSYPQTWFPWNKITKGGATPDYASPIQWKVPAGSDNYLRQEVGSDYSKIGTGSNGDTVVFNSAKNIGLWPGGFQQANLIPSGKLALGGSFTPAQSLHLKSSSDAYIRAGANNDVDWSLLGTGSNGDTVVYNNGVKNVAFYTQATVRAYVDSNGHFKPASDNAYTCGASGARWSAIWSANGTIQTSDQRKKYDINNSALGLSFIEQLRPVSYKFKDGGNLIKPSSEEFEEFEEFETETVQVMKPETVIDNGRAIIKMVEVFEQRTVFDEYPLFNEHGEPVMEEHEHDGTTISIQVVHRVPRVKIVKKPKMVSIPTVGKRTHWGLIAQEVKEVVDTLGIDFGGYIHDGATDEIGLRYDQFIAPLIKAVQELSNEIKKLKGE